MRKKQKESVLQEEYYELSISNFDVAHEFGSNKKMSIILQKGLYLESSMILIYGKIKLPETIKDNKAEVTLFSDPNLDSHCHMGSVNKNKPSPSTVGYIGLNKANRLFYGSIKVPQRLFQNILLSLNQDLIRFISIFGSRLKWNSGEIYRITLFKNHDLNNLI